MTQIIDSWFNSLGERVEMTDSWQFVVHAANGQPVKGKDLTPTRVDRATSANNTSDVIEAPFMAVRPYWQTDKK